jgi:hypothetical protein
MAQLPYLVYDQKPPMSSSDFKALAKSLMSKNDADIIDNLFLDANVSPDRNTGCRFIDNWYAWDRELRLNLARQRVVKIKRDNAQIPQQPDYHMDVTTTVTKAIDETSPLEGEIVLDKARWSAIESFVSSDYFDRSNAFAYYLKLLLLERRQIFNVDKGFAEYKSLYASIVESASESRGEIT